MKISAGYQFADAKVLDFPDNRAQEGLRIPQVPENQFTVQFSYKIPVMVVGMQGRFAGKQFEDDLNQLSMDSYFTLDAIVAFPIYKSFELFVAAENLFNDRYTVGRTPVRTLGPPLLARFGIRLSKD